MTYDLLFFGVFCLLIISYLVRIQANRNSDDFTLNQPMYDLKTKSKEEITGEEE